MRELKQLFGFARSDKDGYERLREMFSVDHHQKLISVLEAQYTIDLSASRLINHAEIVRLESTVEKFNTWLETKRHKSYYGEAILLTEEDHRKLGSAIEGADGKRFLANFFGTNVADFSMMETETVEDVPAGRCLSFYQNGNEFFQTIIVTQFNKDSSNPLAGLPIEVATAEEMLHRVAEMDVLSAYLGIPHDDVYAAEEIAVKYYVSKMLGQTGYKEAKKAFQRNSQFKGYIDVWKSFIRRVADDRADWLFFNGYGGSSTTKEDWDALADVLRDYKKDP